LFTAWERQRDLIIEVVTILSYEDLPDEILTQFYFEIKKNIEKGILSQAMEHELELIKEAAAKKGVVISDFHHF